DNADLHRLSHVAGRCRRYPHVGVIASPPRVTAAVARPGEVPYDVAIGVEQAHARYGDLGQVPLTPRLPQQVLGPEDRLLCVLLPSWQRPSAIIYGMQAGRITSSSRRFHVCPGQGWRVQGEAGSVANGAAAARNA